MLKWKSKEERHGTQKIGIEEGIDGTGGEGEAQK